MRKPFNHSSLALHIHVTVGTGNYATCSAAMQQLRELTKGKEPYHLLVSTEDRKVVAISNCGCILQLRGRSYCCSLRCMKSAGLKRGL